MYNTPLEWKCLDNYAIRNAFRELQKLKHQKNNEHFGTEKPIACTLFYEKKKRKLTRRYKIFFHFMVIAPVKCLNQNKFCSLLFIIYVVMRSQWQTWLIRVNANCFHCIHTFMLLEVWKTHIELCDFFHSCFTTTMKL